MNNPEIVSTQNTNCDTKYSLVHGIFAFVSFALGILWYRWFLYCDYGFLEPISNYLFTVYSVIFCTAVFFFAKYTGRKISGESCFFAVTVILFSSRYIFFERAGVIGNLAGFMTHICGLLLIASVGTKVLDDIVPNGLRALLVAPFKYFCAVFPAFGGIWRFLKRNKAEVDKEKKFENIFYIAVGICVSLPVVMIILVLLSQDTFFKSFSNNLLYYIEDLFSFSFFDILIFPISMFIFSAFYSANKNVVVKTTNILELPTAFLNTVMSVALAVYALFIASQLDGYIAMLYGKIPGGMTYADFARSGFFALCIVACINGIIIYIANVYSSKNSKSSKLFIWAFIAVTFILIVTAAVKMGIYISVYGFTEKRLYTLWFMLLLVVVFILTSVKLKKGQLNLSKVCVIFTALMLLVLFYVDYSAVAEKLNVILGLGGII